MKMTVIYLKETGQVMAAVTRAAPPPAPGAAVKTDPDAVPPEVTALAGAALPVRGFLNPGTTSIDITAITIPAHQLAVLTLDRNDNQLLSPRSYAVQDDEKTLVPLPAAGPPKPTVTTGDSSTVTEELAAEVTADTPIVLVLVPVEGPADTGVRLRGVFKPGTETKKLIKFNVRPPLFGEFDALTLVKGYAPVVWRLNFGGLG